MTNSDTGDTFMNQIRFTVPGEPAGKGRPRFSARNGYVQTHTPTRTRHYEELVKVICMEELKGRMFSKDDMLDVRIIAYYSIPSSISKKKRKMMREHKIRPTKKPDFDNVAKIICDSLNGIAYPDDKQIVDAQVRKFYSDIPCVDVTIRKI